MTMSSTLVRITGFWPRWIIQRISDRQYLRKDGRTWTKNLVSKMIFDADTYYDAIAKVNELGLTLCKHLHEYLDVAEQAVYCAVCYEFIAYAEERLGKLGPNVVTIYLNGRPTDVSTETGQPIESVRRKTKIRSEGKK